MEKLICRYPDRVPIIVESKMMGETQIFKYMVPRDRTIGNMIIQLRRHIKIKSKQAIYIFINNSIPPNSSTIGDIYDKNKSDDNILHVYYSLENTFG